MIVVLALLAVAGVLWLAWWNACRKRSGRHAVPHNPGGGPWEPPAKERKKKK